jgi:hypothetical protein
MSSPFCLFVEIREFIVLHCEQQFQTLVEMVGSYLLILFGNSSEYLRDVPSSLVYDSPVEPTTILFEFFFKSLMVSRVLLTLVHESIHSIYQVIRFRYNISSKKRVYDEQFCRRDCVIIV